MRQISENMQTAEQLIEQINSLPFSEEEKKIFRRVVSVSETAKMTLQEYRRYEEERMFYLDSMAFYYCERAEGRAEGLELVARKMKSAGKDIAEITEMTGLSPTVIATI